MAHAFGIPALPVGQPGHCAFIWYKNGAWSLGNDVSGWDKSSTHSGISYTWMRSSTYFPLMDGAQANLESYRLSEKMRIASKLAEPADVFEILEDASTECPENFAVWEDLEDALNEPGLESAAVQDVLKPTLVAFRESKKEIIDIAPEKTVTSTCSEDTISRMKGGMNIRETWYCKEETATFEMDFETPCTIDEIKIKWWGWSKAATYSISALSQAGKHFGTDNSYVSDIAMTMLCQ